LPDRNKKLSPNSLQEIVKLSKSLPKSGNGGIFTTTLFFFTGNQSFKALLSFALYFTRKRIGFQHFSNISK